MDFEKRLKGIVNTLPKTKILLIDGSDQRSIEAANKLAEFNNLEITLLVENDDKIDTKANVVNMNKDANKLELLAQKYVELRKGKEDIEAARKVLSTRPFYAMMLLATGEVDGVVGGLNYSTADILRALLKQLVLNQELKQFHQLWLCTKKKSFTSSVTFQ